MYTWSHAGDFLVSTIHTNNIIGLTLLPGSDTAIGRGFGFRLRRRRVGRQFPHQARGGTFHFPVYRGGLGPFHPLGTCKLDSLIIQLSLI